jgi:type I restriction enzyme S subunit
MTLPWVELRELVEPKTASLNPGTRPDDLFTYVDVGAVDNKRKTITGARVVRGADAPGRARQQMRTKDVLVSMVRPTLNAVAVVPESLDGQLCSTAFCVLRATPRVLPEYLFFFVRSPLFLDSMHRLQSGSLYPAVTESVVLDQQLPLPDLAAQRHLVEMMMCLNDAIRVQRDLRENSLVMNRAVLVDVFGDTVTNPKGWPLVPLGELLKSGPQNGLHKPLKAYESGTGTRIVRIDSFYDGVLRDQPLLKRLQLDDKDLQRYALAEGDILINRVNSPEYVGKSTVIPALAEPTVFESNMMRFKVDTEQTHPRFIIETLQTRRTQMHFRLNAKRAISQSSLNQQDVKSLLVMLPPLERQANFARYGDAMAASAVTLDAMRKGSEATLRSLLARTYVPGV